MGIMLFIPLMWRLNRNISIILEDRKIKAENYISAFIFVNAAYIAVLVSQYTAVFAAVSGVHCQAV